MKIRIMQEMDILPFTDIDGPALPNQLASRLVWTWRMEMWQDDEEPPWKNDTAWAAASRCDLPRTWLARDTIHLGYEV